MSRTYQYQVVVAGLLWLSASAVQGQVLQLSVDRDSGAGRLSSSTGTSVSADAYVLTSPAGALNVAWNSLDDQNALGGDWREANPTANALSELKPVGTSSFTATGISLANMFDPFAGTFGQSVEDLSLVYSDGSGGPVDGSVVYTGARVNNLLLLVDPVTGAAQFRNPSQTSVDVDAYTIHSEASSLTTTGWSSLDDQNVAGGNWRESNPTATDLSELKPTLATTMAPGAAFSLGNPYLPTAPQDLQFRVYESGEATPINAAVIYQLFGDYNHDGAVDAADYVVWRKMLNQSGNLLTADGNGSGTVDPADYELWRANFGNVLPASGAGALAGSAAAVPEPASVVFVLSILVNCSVVSRRIRS